MTYSAALMIAMLTTGQALAQPVAPAGASSGAAIIPHCFVILSDQADLPPGEPGVLMELKAAAGDQVEANQLLMQVDDRKEVKELEVAQAKLESAKAKAVDDINVRYAVASAEVAKAAYEKNAEANRRVPGTIPQTVLNDLYLKVTESNLAIEKAKLEMRIAAEEAKVAAADVGAAEVAIQRHKVLSPIDGVVIEVRKHRGEWVQPSEPVLKVVRLNKLWIEGYAPTAKYARAEFENCPATVEVVVTRGQKLSFPAKVIFVKPTTEAGDAFLVRAEVENRKVNGSWILSPGLQAEMSVQLTTALPDRNP